MYVCDTHVDGSIEQYLPLSKIYWFTFKHILPHKGTVPAQNKNKNLCYSFDRDENFHTFVKLKIQCGSFSIENELFTENVRKGGPRQRTERSNGSTYTIDSYINRSGMNFVLYKAT